MMQRVLIWLNLYGREALRHKLKNWQKMHFLCFYRPCWKSKDQSIKFSQKILRIGNFEKLSFFESALLEFFFSKKKKKKKKIFIPMKISQSYLAIKDGSKI